MFVVILFPITVDVEAIELATVHQPTGEQMKLARGGRDELAALSGRAGQRSLRSLRLECSRLWHMSCRWETSRSQET